MKKRFNVNQILILIFLFWIIPINIMAQDDDLKKYNKFFFSQLDDYKKWLDYTNISEVINVDTIEIKQDKLFLKMKMPDKHSWNRLMEVSGDIPALIFNKFIFQMDIDRKQGEIEIDGKDAVVYISYYSNQIDIEMQEKMGIVSDNLNIKLKGIKLSNDTIAIEPDKAIEEIKKRLEKGFEEYFKKYKARFGKYGFNKILNFENELVFEISNIKDVVLQEGYFEYLQIRFILVEKEGNVKLFYSINGKYGAGIIWAPKDSRYRDMEPENAEKMRKFNLKVKSKINEILKG